MVLFLFVVMMLDINIERMRVGFWRHLPLGGAVSSLATWKGPEGANFIAAGVCGATGCGVELLDREGAVKAFVPTAGSVTGMEIANLNNGRDVDIAAFADRLTVVHRFQHREQALALLDVARDRVDVLGALCAGQFRPGLERSVRRLHRGIMLAHRQESQSAHFVGRN